jgi:hypothetical protein
LLCHISIDAFLRSRRLNRCIIPAIKGGMRGEPGGKRLADFIKRGVSG